MIKDRFARVKLIKRNPNQRPMSYVGKVTNFTESWVALEGRGLMVSRHESNGVQIDKAKSVVLIPRENIESILVLPANFDIDNLSVTTNGQQLVLVVDGQRDAVLGEIGEG